MLVYSLSGWRNIKIGLIFFLANACNSVAFGQEIQVPHKNITLVGNLEVAPDKSLTDGVILMLHAGLGHYGMETMSYFQSLLRERGYNTLAITLSLGIDKRHGMFDCNSTQRHLNTDAIDEINSWVGWLKQHNVKEFVLFGHSRGGSQAAHYEAINDIPDLKAVVLLSPGTFETNGPVIYQQKYKKLLKDLVSKAMALVEVSKGDTIMKHTGFLYCGDSPVSANTFVSYYGPDPHLDTVQMVTKTKKPTLVILAGADNVVINNDSFRTLSGRKNIQVYEVEEANHFFRDLYADEATDKIHEFLQSLTH